MNIDTCAKCGFQQPHDITEGASAERRNFSCENIDGDRVCVCSQCIHGDSSECDNLPAAELIDCAIERNKVVIFSKSYCPYCQRTKKLFDDMHVEYKAFELDEMSEGGDIQRLLLNKTRQRTVPNVFVSGQHIGGNDDTARAAANGRLAELLAARP